MLVLYNISTKFYENLTGNECCERLAYYGIATNLVSYLTKNLHEGNALAARNVTTWQGTCYLAPLIGALLADAYWGRYWTIAVFSSIYFIVSGSVPNMLLCFMFKSFFRLEILIVSPLY